MPFASALIKRPVVPKHLVHIRPCAVVEFCLVMIIKIVQNSIASPN